MSRLLDSLAKSLRPQARSIGEMTARTLFEGRGNRSEAHLTEYELAAAIATGVEVALLSAHLVEGS